MSQQDGGRLAAAYDNYTITMRLPESIGPERFVATPTNYRQRLAARGDFPKELRWLIAELFQRRAIEGCDITFGRRLALQLARTNSRGHTMLSNGALLRFSMIFSQITGQEIAATWQPAGGAPRGGSGSSIDGNALLRAVAAVANALADGLQLSAAIKILTDD